MRPERFHHAALFGALTLAAVGHVFAQGVTFVVNPSSLSFGPTTVQQQDVSVNISSTGQQALTSVNCPTGLTCTLIASGGQSVAAPGPLLTPFTLRVIANAAAGTTNASIGLTAQGVTSGNIPVSLTYTGGGGTSSFSASPSAINFSQTGSTPPSAASIILFSNTGVVPTYIPTLTYTSGGGWLDISPPVNSLTSATAITVTPLSSALITGTYTATLTLTPQVAGVAPIYIPITLSVGQTGTGGLTAFPNPVVFTYPAGTSTTQVQNVTISGPISGIPFLTTITSLSGNLSTYLTVPSSGATGSLLQLTITNPQFVTAGSSATVTVTPTSGGYAATSFTVQANSGSTGIGSLSVTRALGIVAN